jgi:hypothetical protein
MEYLVCKLIEHISKNIDGLSVVDEDYGQLEAIDNDNVDMYPLTFPAVLIETPETEWSDVADGAQKGTCTVRVRLVLDCYDDTHATSGTIAAVGARNDMRHRLHTLLQGFRPCGDGALMRTKSKFFTWNHGIKVYEMTYTTTVSECVAAQKKKVAKPAVALSVLPGNR